jgi:hypothetical protein
MQQLLRVQGGIQCLAGGMEGCTKRIANDLKDISVISLDRLPQNFMVTREQVGHRIGMLLRDFGTAFNVSEKEGDGAGWQIVHILLLIKIVRV